MTTDRTRPAGVPRTGVDWPLVASTFAVVLAVYVATTPRTVTLEDDGFFILSAWFAGTSHPPGYPLQTILFWPFTLLPVGSPAFRIHLASAVFGAAACGMLAQLARMLGIRRLAAGTAAVALGVSDAFWSQSIIAEVYSLNALLYFGTLGCCLAARDDTGGRWLAAAAVVAGLGCSDHWPVFVACGPALVVVIWPRWRDVLRAAPRLAGCVALGLLPYAWLVLRSRPGEISFYGPIDSWDHFWFVVLSRGYGGTRVNPVLGLDGTLAQLRFWGAQAIWQFTPVGAAVAAAGAVLAWRRWPRGVAAGVLVAALATPALVLVAVNQPMDDAVNRAVLRVFPLVSYGMMALWIGLALDALGRRAAVGLALPLLVAAVHVRANDRHDDTWAADYARATLGAMAPGAVAFVHADVDTGPVAYLHLVEGVRPDVTLYNSQGFVLPTRAAPPWSDVPTLARATGALIDRTTAPLYVFPEPPAWFTPLLVARGGIEDYGFLWRVDRTLPRGVRAPRADPGLMAYLDRVLDETDLTDAWEIHHRHRLIGQAGWMLGTLLAQDTDGSVRAAEAARVARVTADYLGRVRMVDAVSSTGDPAELLARLRGAEALLDDTYRDQDRALLPVLRGRLHERLGDTAAAIADYEQALRAMPDPQNPAVARLAQLYAHEGRTVDLEILRRRFGR